MAVRGAGPSRRSHTKSRKGCKTCKRRHIRCDETFPQCRNCTKHQARCDYMDTPASEFENQNASPDRSFGRLTPGADDMGSSWHSASGFSYTDFDADHQRQTQVEVNQFQSDDMHLIQNLSSVASSLVANGVSDMTIWSSNIPRFLNLASSFTFVADALKSLSAGHMALLSQDAELRNVSIHHGAMALGGLHAAIGNFTKANADAALATSIILLSQASDWRSWSSLDAGITSLISTMEPWTNESVFSEFLNMGLFQNMTNQYRAPLPTSQDRSYILQNMITALHHLRTRVLSRTLELHWVEQMLDYAQRLQASEPATTVEEQFNHTYMLRKWCVWIPIQLLEESSIDTVSTSVIAHLYAMVLALQPLFPDVTNRFANLWILRPMQEVLQRAFAVQAQESLFQPHEMEVPLQYPQNTFTQFCERNQSAQHILQNVIFARSTSLSIDSPLYSNPGNLSPLFTPTRLQHTPRDSYSSTRRSSYLGVPIPSMSISHDTHGLSYNTSQWGNMPSPGFPALEFTTEPGSLFDYSEEDSASAEFNQGFVQPFGIWT